MRLLRELGSEIYSMFAGDAVMSVFAILIVAATAALRFLTPLPSYLVGFGLLVGCLVLLALRVFLYSRKVRGQ